MKAGDKLVNRIHLGRMIQAGTKVVKWTEAEKVHYLMENMN